MKSLRKIDHVATCSDMLLTWLSCVLHRPQNDASAEATNEVRRMHVRGALMYLGCLDGRGGCCGKWGG